MKTSVITFIATATTKAITQDHGARFTKVSIEGDPAYDLEALVIVSVYVDGVPQWVLPIDSHTVAVRPPLRQQGERVEVRCLSYDQPAPDAAAVHRATTPAPPERYGLQAPSDGLQRQPAALNNLHR